MSHGYRILDLSPEFYFHFRLQKKSFWRDVEKIESAFNGLAREDFEKAFRLLPSKKRMEWQFAVELEKGTLKGKVKLARNSAVDLFKVIAFYGALHHGVHLLWDQSTNALDLIKQDIQLHLDDRYRITETIRTERRPGALARLDRLIGQYQDGEISRADFLREGEAILKKICASDAIGDLNRPLQVYLEHRSTPRRWNKILDQAGHNKIPQLPRAPRQDVGLLETSKYHRIPRKKD